MTIDNRAVPVPYPFPATWKFEFYLRMFNISLIFHSCGKGDRLIIISILVCNPS